MNSLTNITSDQYCRPSVWEAGWLRRLPTAASAQNKMQREEKKKTGQIHRLPRRDREALQKNTHIYKHTQGPAVTGDPQHPVRRLQPVTVDFSSATLKTPIKAQCIYLQT